MKNLKKSINSYSFTEKLTFSALFFLLFALAFAFVSNESNPFKMVLGEETSESSEVSVDSDDNDDESVDSTEEESVDEVDEISVDDSTSLSVDEKDEVSVEDTTKSVDDTNEASVVSEDESTGADTELSVEFEKETSVSDFESITQVGASKVVASEKGKLFYLIPVKINKTLNLDEQGDVVDVQQTLFSRLLELLSF